MDLLKNRKKRSQEILEGKFIYSVLKETSAEINKSQTGILTTFNSSFWSDREYTVSPNQLTLTFDKRIRFLDMRNRIRKSGLSQLKKHRIVYNKIIFGKYNNLVRELAFGYTDAVINELKNLED